MKKLVFSDSLACMRIRGFLLLFTLLAGVPSANLDVASTRPGDDRDFEPHVAPASEEGKAALGRMQLMKECAASLFAAEPRLANPVSFAISNRGDFYVAETFRHHKGVADIREHMDWCDDDLASRTVEDRVELLRKHEKEHFADYSKATDRIRIIRDTDGDGVADEDKIFADGFNEPSAGIGAGVLVRNKNVYYTCIPKLWLLTDRDGDGVAEERKVLQHGYGVHIAMLGHDLHGLRMGPDGKLYFSCGDRALNVETPSGRVEWPEAGAVLRCNLDGSELEIFARGLRNPQELAFDEFGNLFTGDNNSDGGDRARWVHVIEGADSGWRYGYQWIGDPHLRGPWNEEKLWYPHFAGQAAYIVPPVSWLGNGPAGLTYYPGTGLSQDYKNHFFLVEFEGDPAWSGIFTFTIKPKGASYELGPVDKFVWNALPTDCDFGPDGAFYFIDWVGGWDPTGKGRIYKITHPAMKADVAAAETQQLLKDGFERRSVGELAKLLSNADQRVRQEAQFELAARGADGAAALEAAAAQNADPAARRHGIWGLGMAARAGTWKNEIVLLNLLSNADGDARLQAARVAGDLKIQAAAPRLVELLKDGAAPVRLAACIALSKLKFQDAADALFALANEAGEDDPALRHGASMALAACAPPERLIRMASDPSPHARIAAIVALRHDRDAGAAAFLNDSDPRVALEAARAIYDPPVAAAYPKLADKLNDPKLIDPPTLRRALGAALREGGLSRARAVAALAARADAPEAARLEALEHLKHWNAPPPRDAVTGEWRPIARDEDAKKTAELYLPTLAKEIASKGMESFPDAVLISWLQLVAQYKTTNQLETAGNFLLDLKRGAKVRGEAMRAIIALQPADLAARLGGALADSALEVRVAAIEAIRKHSPAEALAAAKSSLAQASAPELRIAMDILAQDATPEANAIFNDLAARYESGLLPAEVRLEFAAAADKKYKEKTAERFPSRAALAKADPELAPWFDALYGGDASRGNWIFRNNNSVSCLRCHKSNNDDPGVVGPDLRGLAARSTRLQILESIVEPNRKISNGYQSTVFELNNNTVLSGRVESEDAKIIKVRKADNSLVEIPPADVRERRNDISAMPEGMSRFLTKIDVRDLIEFLATLK